MGIKMAIDLVSLSQAVTYIKAAFDTVKVAKDMLPDGSEKQEAETALAQAERSLKLAEGQMASGLEYELCRKHFPPEVMLSEDDTIWRCPVCGNEKYTGLTWGAV